MRISDVMTTEVRALGPDRTVRDAARLMDELNVGVLPVCLGERLVGVITDRDIVVRSTASGTAPGDQSVQEVMTADPTTCGPDDDAAEVLRRMSGLQVRRMPAVGADGRLVGIVSLGDLAADGAPGADEALRQISTPAEPDLSGTPSTSRAAPSRDAGPSPLTDEERQELDRRLGRPDRPRGDEGRAPDPDRAGGAGAPGLAFTDADDVRAAFGSFGEPASGGGDQHMPGGFGGDGYAHFGQNFGPGASRAPPVPLVGSGDRASPDSPRAADEPTTSGPATAEEGHAGRAVFSSGSHDPGSGRGSESEPVSGADLAASTGNPGAGTAGTTSGTGSGERTGGG